MGCAFMETDPVSEAVTPLPLEFDSRPAVSSTGGELEDNEIPFPVEYDDGEG